MESTIGRWGDGERGRGEGEGGGEGEKTDEQRNVRISGFLASNIKCRILYLCFACLAHTLAMEILGGKAIQYYVI